MEAQRKISVFENKYGLWKNKFKTKSKSSFKRTVQFLIENSYFTVGNVLLIQSVGVPMEIDPISFRANLYSCNYESNK